MNHFLRFSFYLFCIVGTLSACQEEKKSPPKAAPSIVKTGHQRMVLLLDSLDKNVKPEENYHLNIPRAIRFKEMAEKEKDLPKRLGLAYKFALQMTFAGKTKEAVETLEEIIRVMGGLEQALTERNLPMIKALGVAYLRKGELENCVANHTSASCIFPLEKEGFHSLKSGSENAIRVYTEILKKFPDDRESRYLLNVAYMTLGKYPKGIPAAYRLPSQMFAKKGNLATFLNIAVELGVDVNGIAGGCSIEDFDNDGFLDIMASSYMYGDQVVFFRNNGKGEFENQTEAAGLTGITGGFNLIHADYNNDGYPDVFILRGGWLGEGGKLPNSLLRNNGDGTFSDVTMEAKVLSFHPTQTAVWTDVNQDGWLDLFIGNETGNYISTAGNESIDKARYENPCELFLNQQDGTFTESAATVGLNVVGFVKGVTAGDLNNDGWPDLYLSIANGSNLLYVNRAKAGKIPAFDEIAATAGVQEPIMSFPTWFWDYDNDGFEDIFVGGYELKKIGTVPEAFVKEWQQQDPEVEMPRVYRNNGDNTFSDMTASLKLNKVMFAMGCNYGDLDNDGFEDFYIGTGTPELNSLVPNRMFRNVDGKYFEEVTNAGFGHIQKGHGVGFGDLDNDGDQDIYTVMGGAYSGDVAQNVLFENPGSGNNWVTLILQGTAANKSAVGSRVELIVSGPNGKQSIHRTVSTGGSFGSNSLQMEIGLGRATRIDKAILYWASAQHTPIEITELPIKKAVKIIQGSESDFEVVNKAAFPFNTTQKHAHHHDH